MALPHKVFLHPPKAKAFIYPVGTDEGLTKGCVSMSPEDRAAIERVFFLLTSERGMYFSFCFATNLVVVATPSLAGRIGSCHLQLCLVSLGECLLLVG